MTVRSSLASRTIGARATLTGLGNSLENVITYGLDDGSRCYVTGDHSEWQLQRDSTASPGSTVVVPIAGPGRWLKNTGGGAQGAQGATGPQGAQGFQGGGGTIEIPFPVADIDAVGIPDGKIIVASGGIATWGDVPVAFDITGFGLTVSSLVQVGQTVTNPTFSASYNQAATSASLTDTESHNDVLALPATSITSPHAFVKTGLGDGVGFTLHAASALGSDTAGTQLTWGANIYFGTRVDPGVYNEAFIESLTASLRVNPAGSYTMPLVSGGKGFFCVFTSAGLTIDDFFVDGFPWACSKVAAAVNVTNSFFVTLAYDVFRADNIIPGAYGVDVT